MKQCWYQANYYLGLTLFGLGSALYNVFATLCFWLPAGSCVQRCFRALIFVLLRAYIGFLQFSGALRYTPPDLSQLPKDTGLIFIANHPSILDAPLLLSRTPRFICFFKSALKRNLFSGHGARLAGYVSNDEGVAGLRRAVDYLDQGGWVLIFPEGTRTVGDGFSAAHGGFALLAARARCPVVCLRIETNSNVLSKKTRFWKQPQLPAHFRIRVLTVQEPDGRVKAHDWLSVVKDSYLEEQHV